MLDGLLNLPRAATALLAGTGLMAVLNSTRASAGRVGRRRLRGRDVGRCRTSDAVVGQPSRAAYRACAVAHSQWVTVVQ